MNLDRYTQKAQEAILAAQRLATEAHSPVLDAEHLLAALLDDDQGVPATTLRRVGVDVPRLRMDLAAALSRRARVEGSSMSLDRRAQQLLAAGGGRGTPPQGRVRLHGAPADRGQRVGRRCPAPAGRGRRRQGGAPRRPGERARRAAGDQPEPRIDLPGPGAVRPRPDGRRTGRQARPGHRPRRGDPAGHPGPQPADEEQPRPDRRAGRRQDRHRGGPGPAHRARRRARVAQGEARRVAGPWRPHRRRQVPRRVRGAPQGRAQGDQGLQRPGHPLHRRAPHRRRRGGRRRRHGRQQPAQAHAGARRAAHHRRHDPRRVPQAHREGRRPGAALPAGLRGPAVGGGDDLHPARPARAVRGPSRRPHHRFRARRRGHAEQPLHQRPLPARQGHRSRRRGRQPHAHRDRLDAHRAR